MISRKVGAHPRYDFGEAILSVYMLQFPDGQNFILRHGSLLGTNAFDAEKPLGGFKKVPLGRIRSGEEVHPGLSEIVALATVERDRRSGVSVSPSQTIVDSLLAQFKQMTRDKIPEPPFLIALCLVLILAGGERCLSRGS